MQKFKERLLDLKGKRVFIRADLNAPLNHDLSIADDTRIRAALPTIKHVISQGGRAIIASHLGRPSKPCPELSLAPCAKRLSELLGQTVPLAPDSIGPDTKKLVSSMKSGEAILLENLRFHRGECHPEDDPTFATKLAELADYYVDDAFACAHRSHASITSITQYFPGACAAGFLLEKEIAFLSSIFDSPKRPFYALCGGAKISSKIGVLNSLIGKVDALFIGGAMALTFLKAKGIDVGNSKCDEENLTIAKQFIETCALKNIPLHLPEDIAIVKQIDPAAPITYIDAEQGIPSEYYGIDIGPNTCEKWAQFFPRAQIIFWNGPMGIFEIPEFAQGTFKIAEAMSQQTCTTIVGGGDSVAAINQLNLAKHFTHISTGGGASLEYIEHNSLPGIDALSNQQNR